MRKLTLVIVLLIPLSARAGLQFNGTADRLQVASTSALQITTSFSMSAWINISRAPNQETILSKGNNGGAPNFIWQIARSGTTTLMSFYDGSAWQDCTTAAFAASTWYQVTLTYDGAHITCYVNGTASTQLADANSVPTGTDPLNVGVQGNPSSNTFNWFHGTIAELAVWKGAVLTAGEISTLAKGVPPSGFRRSSLSLYLPLQGLQMAQIGDSFNQSDGALNANWSSVFGSLFVDSRGTGGLLVASNAQGPVNANGGDAYAVWKASTFHSNANQYASGAISTIAAYTSVVSITAASQSGGNTTYTYTLTSGAALIVPQLIEITGMADAGNNGNFLTTGLGSGTFTVANASGVTRAGQSGTGNSPSDSNAGLCLRSTSDGLNGYFLIAGTNSYGGDGVLGVAGVKYDVEMWKFVSGTGTLLAHTASTSIPDSANDVYLFTVTSNSLAAYKNGSSVLSATDSSLTTGVPGVWSWSLSGANEYNWANWSNAGVMGTPPGNNGTRWTNYTAGDMPPTMPDLSGNQSNATVFGTLIANHCQCGKYPVGQ